VTRVFKKEESEANTQQMLNELNSQHETELFGITQALKKVEREAGVQEQQANHYKKMA